MEYLPSKKFGQKVLALLIVTVGWFYFSGKNTGSIINNNLAKDESGLMVFSRTTNTPEPDMARRDEWGNISENNTAQTVSSVRQNPLTLGNDNILSGMTDTFASEIKTFSGTSKELYKNYGKKLVLALKPYSSSELPNEGEIAAKALGSGDYSELEKILAMGKLHAIVAINLKKIEVPEEIKFRHLFLIKNIEKLSFLDGILADAFEDPKRSINAIERHRVETNGLLDSVIDINNFFKEKAVDFTKDEKIMIYIKGIK